MSESYIQTGSATTTFVGPDAVRLFQATAIRSAMEFYLKTGMKVNRAYTPTNMVKAANAITGKTRKVGPNGMTAAVADLTVWIATMRAALPVVEG